jgi:alanine racemase
LRECGVAVVTTDVASSAPLAAGADGTGVRLGVGLFGFRFGAALPGVAGTLRVRAPVVRTVPAEGQLTSYGTARAPREGWLVVVRCGYGDGFPRVAQPWDGVLAVGMQYAVLHRMAPPEQAEITLLDETTDLDGLAQAARIGPHELVVRLGQAESARRLRNLLGSRM